MPQTWPLIVFDWDGTLIDSIPRIVTSLQYASETVLGEAVSAARARSVIGLGLREAVEKLHPHGDAASQQRLIDAYKQHFLFESEVPAPLFPGAEALLRRLREAGHTLAIATGKSRQGLERNLAEHGLGELFAATRCADEIASKPAPDMLLDLLRQFDLDASQALMIGDSEHDLQMAQNAGVGAIGVCCGVQNRQSLQKYAPLACFDRVSELGDWLLRPEPAANII